MSLGTATDALRALTYQELDEITQFRCQTSTPVDCAKRQKYLDDVRNAVIEADRTDLWDVPRRRGDAVHDLVDRLVPALPHDRIVACENISATWDIDLAAFPAYASAYDLRASGIQDLEQNRLDVLLGRVLYLTYTYAIRHLVAWVEERGDADFEDEEGHLSHQSRANAGEHPSDYKGPENRPLRGGQ